MKAIADNLGFVAVMALFVFFMLALLNRVPYFQKPNPCPDQTFPGVTSSAIESRP